MRDKVTLRRPSWVQSKTITIAMNRTRDIYYRSLQAGDRAMVLLSHVAMVMFVSTKYIIPLYGDLEKKISKLDTKLCIIDRAGFTELRNKVQY
jgi:hypothetical protein